MHGAGDDDDDEIVDSIVGEIGHFDPTKHRGSEHHHLPNPYIVVVDRLSSHDQS